MTVDPDLLRLLKRLKLGALAPTLPDRLALAGPSSWTTLRSSLCWPMRCSGAITSPSRDESFKRASRSASRWRSSTGMRPSRSIAASSTPSSRSSFWRAANTYCLSGQWA